MREYTDLAFSGNFKQAREVRDSLNPVREAINKTKPAEKPLRMASIGKNCWDKLEERCVAQCWI